MREPRRVYFSFMGAFWSCTPDTWERLTAQVERDGIVPDLGEWQDVRELRSRPHGIIHRLKGRD